jgi:prephenate dehydrogenase
MNWINDNSILIVGLGLMGGSIAKGLKRLGFHVEGIDNRQESIDYAVQNKIIDRGYAFPDETAIRNADVMIFALYPEVLKKWIRDQQHLFKQGLLITDVTGVKSCIVYDIQSMLRDDVEYVPAHPMAGREVYGVENADDNIFRGANFIVAPTGKNTEKGIAWCRGLGQILGFRKISLLSPEEHDEMIGFLSQLTHCIAITLMTCNDKENMEKFTGDSFRDLTRIARINDLMWSELFVANKDVLLEQMDLFINQFNSLKTMLKNNDIDGMRKMMQASTARRALFDKK